MELGDLVAEQNDDYRRRAREYDATVTPPDDALADFGHELERSLHRLRPAGEVLEIACGTGGWTRTLLQHASRVTCLDASPKMTQLAASKLDHDPRVAFVNADVFSWEPEDRYDVVFMANWLSHVPPSLFGHFWGIVRDAIRPDGRVLLIDELEDAWRHENPLDIAIGGTTVPIVRRATSDGRQYRVVKRFWGASELESDLRSLGWEIAVQEVGPFFLAVGQTS